MARKGKNNAPAPAAPTKPAASSAGSKAGKKEVKKPPPPPPPPAQDELQIIFTNSDKEPKPKKTVASGGGDSAGAAAAAAVGEPSTGPPKPTVKQIIGGASWTGKLPVNLLSEHCQRQKWDRPDYITHRNGDDYSVMVSLSAKNPKTREVTKLPPFKLPPSHVDRAHKPTALEARHFAATYALFRVCSMRNLHMSLPPDYRSLWKEFEALKKQDVKEGKGWMYEADPFQAQREREEAKAAAERKRAQQQAAREAAASQPGATAALAFRGSGNAAGGGGAGAHQLMRGWANIPSIEMGNKTRAQLEDILRRETVWNPHSIVMTAAQKSAIVLEFKGLGFRQSHVEEAVEECRDREETLEWLLTHIPEDDLPRWALPEKYSAGITMAATDLRREGAIKRLAESGYSGDLCRKIFDAQGGDEGKAAEELQRLLLESGRLDEQAPVEADSITGWMSPDECWGEEMTTLEASFAENFTLVSPQVCQIRLGGVRDGERTDVGASLQLRKSPSYPAQVTLSVVADLPAYIKLSIIKKALAYVHASLKKEELKIYFITSWVQEHINDIIERPGALRDVAAVASAASEDTKAAAARRTYGKRRRRHPNPIDWTPVVASKAEWLSRAETAAYQKMLAQRQRLPAWHLRDDIVRTVTENQVTIISGETGSGKSTQSVQFILDDMYRQGLGNAANIIVTQPRRISALGLADRVSEERCSPVGQEVGYVIRGESKTSGPRTKITFVTCGVLLQRLQTSGGRTEDVVASLADVSHVVIDEVHERSLDTDFLLSILRDVLSKRSDLKLVLMSATLDAATFVDYFASEGGPRHGISVGLVEIAGRTFPVHDFYLDDVIRMTGFTLNNSYHSRYETFDDDTGDKGPADPINKIIQRLGGRINYDLVVETVKAIDQDLLATHNKPTKTGGSGGILLFLPGVAEINRACSALRAVSSLHVLPLHASLETREQRRVFNSAPPGKRKVVVATNVAETSITIDDIVAVVDTGRVKETSYDPQTNMRRLGETWASRAACKQRRGRAGRVTEGKCYKLYTRNLETATMVERPDPEIRRVPLEQICLSVLAMGISDVRRFLSRAPTPPDALAVEEGIRMLRRIGALDVVGGGSSGNTPNELTALGRQLAVIPADLRCGKLMVFGAVFGCLDDCVAAAAILSTRSPFLSPSERRDEAKAARMRFSHGDGDLLTDLRAFQEWDRMMAFGGPQRQVRGWCDENFLSFSTLSDISSARAQYYTALAELGIHSRNSNHNNPSSSTSSSSSPSLSSSMALLRALTASAFTPQIVRVQLPDKKFATSMSGAVELDPEARTIRYFSQDNGRVFVHPASTLFDDNSAVVSGGAAFLSYFNMMSTSKIFIRDLTPFNAYTLLLFSGSIELDTQGRGLIVDGWLRLRGWARIGVLVSRLRGVVDRLIARKVDDPAVDLGGSDVVALVVKLIELDGLDA